MALSYAAVWAMQTAPAWCLLWQLKHALRHLSNKVFLGWNYVVRYYSLAFSELFSIKADDL